ncbi:MAG: hypothetical protein GYB53_15110 [Rhodobacteraceae bacterium]|nr:hypothetical protein [Paracoccaceae bacterium]MBR9823739.1 hypothetical protein [Paracoccaceae bacterium]
MPSDDDLQIQIGLTERKYLQQMARLEAQTQRAAAKLEQRFIAANTRSAKSFQQVEKSSSALANGGLRQILMQLSQVSQQGAATGQWGRALSIQAADISLAFGTAGIAVGALISALGPLALDLLESKDAAEALTEAMEKLDASLAAMERSSASLAMSGVDVRKKYAALSDEAQRLFDIQYRLAQLNAQEALRGATQGLAESMGLGGVLDVIPAQVRDISAAIEDLKRERDSLSDPSQMSDEAFLAANKRIAVIDGEIASLKSLGRNLDEVGKMFGFSGREAEQFGASVVARFAEIGQAQGPEQQAEQMQELVDYIWNASENLKDADDEGKALYQRLVDVVSKALELSSIDIAKGFREAKEEAEGLSYAPGPPRRRETSDLAPKTSIRPQMPSVNFGESTKDNPNKTGGGGMSEAERERNRLLSERDRILRSLETAQDAYNRQLADLNKLEEMGELSSEQYQEALADLDQALVEAEFANVISGIDSVSKALAEARLNGENMGEAVVSALRSILAQMAARQLTELFTGLLGLGDVGRSMLGRLLGVGGQRASGGKVRAGVPYMVGEHGPEPFIPDVNGQILSAASARDVMSGGAQRGGGGMTVNVFPQPGQEVERRETQGPDGESILDLIMGEVGRGIESGRFDPEYMARFGNKPTVKRR